MLTIESHSWKNEKVLNSFHKPDKALLPFIYYKRLYIEIDLLEINKSVPS